jgi:hypothetical protein
VGAAALTDGAAAQGGTERPGGQSGDASVNVPASIRALRPMTGGIVPISIGDRRARLDKARRLMAENHIDAIVLEGGSRTACTSWRAERSSSRRRAPRSINRLPDPRTLERLAFRCSAKPLGERRPLG